MDSAAGAPFGLQYRTWRCQQLLWRDRTSILVIAAALLCCAWRLAAPTCLLGPAAVASQHAAEAARTQQTFWLAQYASHTAARAAPAVAADTSHASQCLSTSCRDWPLVWRITCGCWLADTLKPGRVAPRVQQKLVVVVNTLVQVVAGPLTLGVALGSLLTLGAMVSIIPYILLVLVPLPALEWRSTSAGQQLTPLARLRGWHLVWRAPGWFWLVPCMREGGTMAYRLFLSALQLASMGPYRGHELLFDMYPCGQWRHSQYAFKCWHGVLQVLPPRLQLACCCMEWVLTLALVIQLDPELLALPPPSTAAAAAGATCVGWLRCLLAAPLLHHLVSSLVLLVGVPTAAAWVLEKGMRSRWRASRAPKVHQDLLKPGPSKQFAMSGGINSSGHGGNTSSSTTSSDCHATAGAQGSPIAKTAHVGAPCSGGVASSDTVAAAASPDLLAVSSALPTQQQQQHQQQGATFMQPAPPQGLMDGLEALLGPEAVSSLQAAWGAPESDEVGPGVYVASSILLPVGIKVEAAHSRVADLEPALLGALQGVLEAAAAPTSPQQQQVPPGAPQVVLAPAQGAVADPIAPGNAGGSYAVQAVCFQGCVHLLGCVYTPSSAWQLQRAAKGALQAQLVAQVQQGLGPNESSGGIPPIAAVVGTATAATAAAAAAARSTAKPSTATDAAGEPGCCEGVRGPSVGSQFSEGMLPPAAEAGLAPAVDVCYLEPPVCVMHQSGQQWVTLYLLPQDEGGTAFAIAERCGSADAPHPSSTSCNTNSSSGEHGGSSSSCMQGCTCRLLVFSQQQVVMDEVMPLVPVLRFLLPPLRPGVYHLAILPTAAAAGAAPVAAAGSSSNSNSSRNSPGRDTSAAPWVLQPLLALPPPAAKELQRHWQRLCSTAQARQRPSCGSMAESGPSPWQHSGAAGEVGSYAGAPYDVVKAAVWRSVWSGLIQDMACIICNTPPAAQTLPRALVLDMPTATVAPAAAGGDDDCVQMQPDPSAQQQQQQPQQQQEQLLVATLQVLMRYLTRERLLITAQHLVGGALDGRSHDPLCAGGMAACAACTDGDSSLQLRECDGHLVHPAG